MGDDQIIRSVDQTFDCLQGGNVRFSALQNEVLRYILENGYHPGDPMPTIQEMAQTLGVSVAKTRESLEIARALGVVEIKPGRGTRVAAYRFAPAATLSALYAIGQNGLHFTHLREVRNALEIHFWEEAVRSLEPEDLIRLRGLIATASRLLQRQPIQVPAAEHRQFHMTIFAHLENPFVLGILEAFWEAYEAFGLNLYRDLHYHRTVWDYHERIVDAIEAGEVETSRRLLVEHMSLLSTRPLPSPVTTSATNQHTASFE